MEPNAPPTAMSRYFCKAISSFNIIFDLGIAPEDNSATGFPVRSHHLSSYWEGTAVKGELLHHNQHSKNIILRPMEFRWKRQMELWQLLDFSNRCEEKPEPSGRRSHHKSVKALLRHLVSAPRGVADVNLGLDAGFGGITASQFIGKGRSMALFNQVDGAAAKSSARKPRAN